MNINKNIERFEKLMDEVVRTGVEDLMNYIRKSDFYKAPASTKYHLSCEGGLLQHSLNVFDALIAKMEIIENEKETDGRKMDRYVYKVAGKPIADFIKPTLITAALLHDICKTNFYTIGYRNQKIYRPGGKKHDNGGWFDWVQVPVYEVEDRNPYGHGEKSVMMICEFMDLTMEERYAIRWHMGMSDCTYQQMQAFNASCEKFPLVHLLHMADQEASHFMEDTSDNKPAYAEEDTDAAEAAQPAGEYADQPVFQEATPM
nr:hydrolase [uncultured Dysosmobacter sp.]